MRTIKFRGKRVDNGEWVYGVPYFLNIIEDEPEDCVNKACIIGCVDWDGTCGFMSPENRAFIEVQPETVGQFTGLLDKDGKEIYEFDHFGNTQHYVYFYQGGFYLGGVPLIGYFNGKCIEQLHDVKGTIHDNPELP